MVGGLDGLATLNRRDLGPLSEVWNWAPCLSLPTTTDERDSASVGEYDVSRLYQLAKKLVFQFPLSYRSPHRFLYGSDLPARKYALTHEGLEQYPGFSGND
jgi:hypothetical protein